MSNGTHTLELAAYVDSNGILESARSAQFRVTVAAISAGEAQPLGNGDVITTTDGIELRTEVLFENLVDPSALSIAKDGRTYVATDRGLIIIKNGEAGSPQLTEGRVVALDLSPDFERDSHVFVTEVVRTDAGESRFRTSRYVDLGGWLAQRMVVFETGPASADPRAVVRIGPDAKLYSAFDDGGNPLLARKMSDWTGKLLRMEPDGRTPPDQAAASPVLFSGLMSPRGFDWNLDRSAVWLADASRDGTERLRVLITSTERPRRTTQREVFTLPSGAGAAALAFYRHEAIRAFVGDLFIAARDGGYLLRVRFSPHSSRPVSTERLLEDLVGSVRTLAMGGDGAIYVCAEDKLLRLSVLDR
jgi:glucose/arabinose dehydrogenase